MLKRSCQRHGWLHGKFRGCGYRLTLGREAILNVLAQTQEHLSAEDVYKKVHAQYPQIGLTTVYRTLDALSRAGLVARFDFGDKRARYELAEGPKGVHHHHHLVCTQCHRIIEYTDFIDDEVELLRVTEKGLQEKYQFKITNHLIQFYGICSDCSEE